MGECTGHAVRGGSNIVLMAQECSSLIVPVAKKLISRIRNSRIVLQRVCRTGGYSANMHRPDNV